MPGGRQHYRLQTPAPDEQPPAWCGLLNCTSVTDNGYIALLQDVEVGLQCTRVNGGAIKLFIPWTTKNNVGLQYQVGVSYVAIPWRGSSTHSTRAGRYLDCVVQYERLLRHVRNSTMHSHVTRYFMHL